MTRRSSDPEASVGYRESSRPRARQIPYGRFPRPIAGTVAGLFSLLMALGFGAAAMRVTSFECARKQGEVRCAERVTVGDWELARRELDPEALARVEWVPLRGRGWSELGRTDAFDREGRRVSVLERTDREDAHDAFEALKRFLADENARALVLEDRPWLWLGLAVSLLALVGAHGFFGTRSSAGGRITFIVDPVARVLTVERRRFLRRTRREQHPLDGLEAVVVEPHRVQQALDYPPGVAGGRLVLEYVDGPVRPLTEPLPGEAVHEEAADALNRALGLHSARTL